MLQAIHRNVEGGVQPRSQRSRKAEAEAGRIVTQSSNGCTSAFFAPSTMRYLTGHRLWMMSNGKSSGLPKFLLRTPTTALSRNFLRANPYSIAPLEFISGRPSLIASLPGLSGDLPTGVTSPTNTVQARILSRIDRATSGGPVRPSNFLTHPLPLSRSARRHNLKPLASGRG
jgi:hypothetical protein